MKARRPLAVAVLCIGVLGLARAALAAGAEKCDPDLMRPDDTRGYQWRGDRCEGLYVQPVASHGDLLVASLTEEPPDFDPSATPTLELRWTPFGDGPIHVRAYSLRHGTYYRMDAVRPAGARSYRWPLDVLREVGLPGRAVGLIAWTQHRVGTTERPVYLPLRLATLANASAPHYRMRVVPGVRLDEMWVGLVRLDEAGEAKEAVESKELGLQYYPAGQPVPVTLEMPEDAPAGVYRAEIRATCAGGAVSTRLWLAHGGG